MLRHESSRLYVTAEKTSVAFGDTAGGGAVDIVQKQMVYLTP